MNTNWHTELVVVVPVYNEGRIIEQFITEWVTLLRSLQISFEFRLYDDGSTDNSEAIIQKLQSNYSEIKYNKRTNSGHGQTITYGYLQGTNTEWVFQIDSDHELSLDLFPQLWANRSSFDLLMGVRVKRSAPPFRRILTKIASIVVSTFFGKGLSDINVPYRLIRSEKLLEFLPFNQPSNFAPNVLMTAFAVKDKWRIKTLPVLFCERKKTTGSGFSVYMFTGACNSAWQLVKLIFLKTEVSK